MTRPASIVVGLGFGDEGKGLTTDYLCSKAARPLVVRFNGGQQAGPTVVLSDRRHVFSSFGSGTLRGAATYWSAYCTCALPNLLKELKALQELGVKPKLLLDIDCAITTHYDVLYNQLLEQKRGNGKHGSCGMGFGATLERQSTGLKFKVKDLLHAELCEFKLHQTREYYVEKAATELNLDFSRYDHAKEDARFGTYFTEFHRLLNDVFFIAYEEDTFRDTRWSDFIFEGAQGILLDMDFGHFPHVTRSNTTSKNALEIISRNKETIGPVELYYVSRCYHTRHGEGPFVPPDGNFILQNAENETNIFNPHQGSLRTAPLAIDKMQYALQCDNHFSKGLSKNLVFTCLDQLTTDKVLYTNETGLHSTDIGSLPGLTGYSFSTVYHSHHPCGEYLKTAVQQAPAIVV